MTTNRTEPSSVKARLQDLAATVGQLDGRSLACFRILTAGVLLYDIGQSWEVVELWLGLQGYVDRLPAFIDPAAVPTALRLALIGYALAVVCWLIGYQTARATAAVWLATCLYQHAWRHTIDYHHLVLANLLLWCLALPMGQRLALDRRRGQTPPAQDGGQPHVLLAGCGFVMTLAYVYLDTALMKTGPAWWSQGTAVWFAVREFSASSAAGLWATEVLPFACFRAATHLTLAVEIIAPLLILSPWHQPRLRLIGCGLLLSLHWGMWLLLDIGAFPATMMAATAALLPSAFWDGVVPRLRPRLPFRTALPLQADLRAARGHRPGASDASKRRSRALSAFLIFCVLVNVEGSRLRASDRPEWPYPGAEWVLRFKYVLGLETRWTMYAPEPYGFGGWWVAAGPTADGRELDPITGLPPDFARPSRSSGAYAGLHGYFWSLPPVRHMTTGEDAYADYLHWLAALAERPDRVPTFSLFYVYEPHHPSRSPSTYPLLIAQWPPKAPRPNLVEDGALSRTPIYRVDFECLDDPLWSPQRLPTPSTY